MLLENLRLNAIPISLFPTGLRTLRIEGESHPSLRFWQNLFLLNKLEVLQLFSHLPDWAVERPEITVDCSQITNVRLTSLRTF